MKPIFFGYCYVANFELDVQIILDLFSENFQVTLGTNYCDI